MSIEPRDLQELSELARLELSDEQLRNLVEDCRAILDYFDEIRQLDVTEVEPSGVGKAGAPLREDVEDPDPLELPPESFAPEWREGFFVLPRLPALDETAPEREE